VTGRTVSVRALARRTVPGALAAAALVALAAPAAAAPGGPGVNPAAYCEQHHYTFTTWDGRVRDAWWIPLEASGEQGLYRFPIESAAGCVSTVAAGMSDGFVPGSEISLPAARAQCGYLEQVRGLRYPTTMYGIAVHNRTGCAHVLVDALAVLPPPASGPPV
jgi:hypothetical protein